MLPVYDVQRSALLDLAWMKDDIRDVKTWIPGDSNGIKFGGVELTRDRFECAHQCAMGRFFPG